MDQESSFIRKILSGGATPAELDTFRNWVEKDSNRQLFQEYKRAWNRESGYTPSPERVSQAFRRVKEQAGIPGDTRKKILPDFRRYSAAAAVFAFLLSGVLFYLLFTGPETTAPTEHYAGGFAEPVVLDSTSVSLNLSDSTSLNLSNLSAGVQTERDGTSLQVAEEGAIRYAAPAEKTHTAAPALYNTLYVPAGQKYTITLSDGTTVYMNSKSSLRYPVQFDGTTRNVSLSGQAYFVVAKDPLARPFIVYAQDFSVRAISTEFDVCAYSGEPSAGMILAEGKVAVNQDGKEYICLPDNQYNYNRETRESDVKRVDAARLTSWRNGVLVLEKIKFRELVRKLESWYGIEIQVSDNRFDAYAFSGEFAQANISTALEILRHNLGTECVLEGNLLTIK